jgi:CheY-like chemotaxis protein
LAQKIIQVAKSDTVPVQRLAQVLGGEPLFAVRLLKLANFSAGPAHTLTAVPQSISILGLHHWKVVAVTLSLFGLDSSPPKDPEAFELSNARRQLWEHALGCAMIAGRLARKSGRATPHLAFAAGLSHDLGRLLLFKADPMRFAEAGRIAQEKALPATEAETLVFGINHAELGEPWARRLEWLPSIEQVMRFHHTPPATPPEGIDEDTRNLITVVRLADAACESRRMGAGGEAHSDWRDLWREYQLRPEEWWDDLEEIKAELAASREMFGFARQDNPERAAIPQSASETPERPIQPAKNAANGGRAQIIPFPTRTDQPPPPTDRPAARKLTILVVEDHGSLCDMLSLYFMRYGYHVRTANNGDTALQLLAKEEIDLVLLDLMLPRVDGFAVLKQMGEWDQERRRPYVIVVSAGASEKDRSKVLELGANEYMPKPFHLIRLLERVQAVESYIL